jgi:hypothetical protein
MMVVAMVRKAKVRAMSRRISKQKSHGLIKEQKNEIFFSTKEIFEFGEKYCWQARGERTEER